MRRKQLAVVTALAVLLAVLVGIGLDEAWAQSETEPLTVSVESGEPTLLARGAGVTVPVIVTCTAAPGVEPESGFISASIRQTGSGRTIVEGGGSTAITPICDGQSRTYDVIVTSRSSAGATMAFKKGIALVTVSAEISGFDPNNGEYGGTVFASDRSTAELRIR